MNRGDQPPPAGAISAGKIQWCIEKSFHRDVVIFFVVTFIYNIINVVTFIYKLNGPTAANRRHQGKSVTIKSKNVVTFIDEFNDIFNYKN